MAGVLCITEQTQGRLRRASLEVVSAAVALNPSSVTALAFGTEAEATAAELGRYGAGALVALTASVFDCYSSDGYANAAAVVVRALLPDVILIAATAWGKDLAPRISGLLGAGLASDCTELETDGTGDVVAIRPMYAGKAFARVRVDGTPKIFSLRPNVFALKEQGGPPAVITPVDIGDAGQEPLAQVVRVESGSDTVELTEASMIVSGGRGMKAPEKFALLDDLAAVLGAAVGSSRPVADEGWVPHSYHVGQTGKVVSPDVYFAVGISGAIQHVAGISNSKYIVAINSDPEAPIFKVANYGIVGDLFEVVPALTRALQAHKDQH